jgi:proteasome lid subunit RPN8/RPN11
LERGVIAVNKEIEAELRLHAERTYPNECCGFLLGEIETDQTRAIKRLLPIDNSREDEERFHRFLITPEDFLAAEKTARSIGLDILGIYHSHPNAKAQPSGYDLDFALPFYSYIITSVYEGKSADINSFRLSDYDRQFDKEEILWR